MNYEEYKQNVDKLNLWSTAYYVNDNPIATDNEYDKLNREVIAYELEHPKDKLSYSPTNRVGGEVLDKFNKAKHLTKMWSLEDIFNLEELTIWFNRIKEVYPNASFYCQPKYDGLSLNLIYNNGMLEQAITRGTGEVGEDVTINAKTIKNIPLTISYKDKIEIRGEVVIRKKDFNKLNEERAKLGEPLFANPRNAAAGSLRQLDSKISASRNLSFQVWGFGLSELKNDFFINMESIYRLGFERPCYSILTKNVESIEKAYQRFIDKRESIEEELDGMVVKVDEISLHNDLGYTNKFPKWACAYKFPALEKVTIVRDILTQVGKTGVITPVAVIDPTELNGAMVERVTLHNFDNIKTKDIRINDQVVVIRSGDVIPKIIQVFTDRRKGDEVVIVPPIYCPCCNSVLVQENVYLRCDNDMCYDKVVAYITDFAAKDNLNIIGLSEGIVKQLVKEDLVFKPTDLYKLTYDDLIILDGFKDKKVLNLLEAIKNSKHPTMDRFIHSLNIAGIGSGVSKLIANLLSKPSDLLELSYETIVNIDGVGKIMADNITKYILDEEEYIWELINLTEPKVAISIDTGKYLNKTFVITGTLSKPRSVIEDYITSEGGRVGKSVTSKTDYLISNDNTSTKHKDALKLGIKIIEEKDI